MINPFLNSLPRPTSGLNQTEPVPKASSTSFLLFSPWLIIMISHLNRVRNNTSWTNRSIDSSFFKWMSRFNSIFFDPGDIKSGVLFWLIEWFIMALIVYSVYFLVRYQPQKVWLFVLNLLISTGLMMLPALLLGKQLSSIMRYQIPSLLAVQIAVAHLIATQISSISFLKRKVWQIIFIILIWLGIGSNIMISQAQSWWAKPGSGNFVKVANLINKDENPIVISSYEGKENNILALSYLLNPNVEIQLIKDPEKLNIESDKFSNVFVFDPSNKWLEAMNQNPKYNLTYVKEYQNTWKLKN